MTRNELEHVHPGLYILHWKSGGQSEASVGCDEKGNLWYAPINWIHVPSRDWRSVKRLIQVKLKDNFLTPPIYDSESGGE